MSLKDVSGDYLSISFISKFERGESEISLSRFLLLLNNLNITIDEFYRLINEDSYNENEQLISKVSQAYYDNNVIVLKKYRDVELEKYNKFRVNKYLYNLIMVEAFICSINNKKMSEESSRILSNYLFGVDYWGKYELMIFGNSMGALSMKTLILLVDELTTKTRLFGTVDENYLAKIRLLINAVYVCINADYLKNSKKYLDQLLSEKFEMQFAFALYQKFMM